MELITALCIGTGIAVLIGLILGTNVIPRLIDRLVQKDEVNNEPGGSSCNYILDRVQSDGYCSDGSDPDESDPDESEPSTSEPDFEDLNLYDIGWEHGRLFHEMPLPADPRARVELSPIERELREAEEYARQHKLKVDEAIDNIKL